MRHIFESDYFRSRTAAAMDTMITWDGQKENLEYAYMQDMSDVYALEAAALYKNSILLFPGPGAGLVSVTRGHRIEDETNPCVVWKSSNFHVCFYKDIPDEYQELMARLREGAGAREQEKDRPLLN